MERFSGNTFWRSACLYRQTLLYKDEINDFCQFHLWYKIRYKSRNIVNETISKLHKEHQKIVLRIDTKGYGSFFYWTITKQTQEMQIFADS